MKKSRQSNVGGNGKALPQFPAGLNEYQGYLKSTARLPKAPAVLEHYQQINDWRLDGNAHYGDCTMAAAVHAIRLWNVITGEKDAVPENAAIVAEYLKLASGPEAPLVEADVLRRWQRRGLWGNRILGFAPVNVHNIALIKQALYLYGVVYAGVVLTKSAENQFKQKKPWALVPGWKTETPVGGHAVPIVGYDQNHFYVVTWGLLQKVTLEWWHTYGDEAWVILPRQLKQAGGADHLKLKQLVADLEDL